MKAVTILYIGILLIFLTIAVCSLLIPATLIQSEKMTECIKAGGQFSVSDWSMKDDGSDYRATCEIPEKRLWQYSY